MTHWLEARCLSALRVRHGFNLRTGGASRGPGYESWNLGRAVGDDPAAVLENHRRYAERLGQREGSSLFETSQVHGAAVQVVSATDDPAAVRRLEADALIAPAGGIAVGVRIADCAPVLLFAEDSGAAAAIHAGWRGTVRGVVAAALRALLAQGGQSSAVHAAIFPHIGRCCFEVGEDVAAELVAASPDPDVVDRSRARPHVDLTAVLTAQLIKLGVAPARIESVPGCTRCEPARFFSFRRDGQHSGRHLAAIVSR